MANLIPAVMRAEAASVMESIFDTFSKVDVVFYKVAAQTVAMFDPNYNADFPHQSSITETAQSQSFTCRVNYLSRQEYGSFIDGGSDVGVKSKFYYNRIKLRLKEDAFAYLQDTERFEILGEKYAVEEGWRRIGIFNTFQFYQIILKRVN